MFGVLAPVFATSSPTVASGLTSLAMMFQDGSSFVYNVLFVMLIFFFCFFWTSITFNPKEMSENLKDHGTFIPGYRPGKRTADFLEKVMVRITYVGAAFLALSPLFRLLSRPVWSFIQRRCILRAVQACHCSECCIRLDPED